MSIFNYVKTRLSILDIIPEYVQLKQAGGYWKGKCPFHSETDASFTVSPDKQIFYCFGCHSSGDVISFIAKIENLSQIEATQHLIEKNKIEIPEELKQNKNGTKQKSIDEKEKFFNSCKAAAEWMNKKLLRNETAISYMTKRSFKKDLIKHFNIGYLPGGIRSINLFIKEMAQQNVLLKKELISHILELFRFVLGHGIDQADIS